MDIYRLDEKIAGLVKKSKNLFLMVFLKKVMIEVWPGKVDIAHYSTTMNTVRVN